MIIRDGGAFRTISGGSACVAGAYRTLSRAIVYESGQWRTAATFVPPLSASAFPTSVEGRRSGDGSVVTALAQVTPEGGQGPYIYSWARVGGGSGVPTSSASARTAFQRSVVEFDDFTETFRCTVTDDLGSTATVDVSARFIADEDSAPGVGEEDF